MLASIALIVAGYQGSGSFRNEQDICNALTRSGYSVDLHQTTSGPYAIVEKPGAKAWMTFASPGGVPRSVSLMTRYALEANFIPDEAARWYESHRVYGFEIHPRITATTAFEGQIMVNSGPPEELVATVNSFWKLNADFQSRFGRPEILDPMKRPLGRKPADSTVLERLDSEEIASLISFWHWDKFPKTPPGHGVWGPMAIGSAYIDGVYANITPVYEQNGRTLNISFWVFTDKGPLGPLTDEGGRITDLRRVHDGLNGKAAVSVDGLTCGRLRQKILDLAHYFSALSKP